MSDALAAGLGVLGIQADGDTQVRLRAYLALLEKWNRTHNLTAISERERMITHHVLDSLSVLPHLPAGASVRIADVGSGGGLPGIPLAVCRREWRVTLIESSRKKAAFLAQAAIELSLSNVDVVAERVERYRPPVALDIAISRAYASLSTFATQAQHLIAPGGWLAAMKGVHPHDEIAALPSGVRVTEVIALHVPGIQARRHLILMQGAAA